jgi:thiol:disulfide interchange protein DsbD
MYMHPPNSGRASAPHTVRVLLTALFLLLTLSFTLCVAQAEDNFLPPEQAFKFSAQMADAQTLEVSYVIADGYYMYRERFHFKADNDAALGQPVFPAGKIKYDEVFKKDVETYRNKVSIRVPVKGETPFRLTVTSQGCTDKGLCYSPMDVAVQLSPISTAAGNTMDVAVVTPAASDGSANTANAANGNDIGSIQASLQSGKLLLILPLFFLLGLGLALTPCVLPMVPILSSIIVGEGARTTRWRGLLLSAIYALGMALVYTALGVAAGLIGQGLAATLQNPWVLSLFALLLISLSLSMFGFYELQIPSAWQTRLSQVSGGSEGGGGKLIGVFVMGAISALIVGPCVAAPLAGALLYISQSRDVFIGGSALFAMAIGMSVPLLLIGVSAGALLPRAGGWMESVKRFFGVLMLATALWMVMPVIPGGAAVLAWALLLIGYGAYMLWGQPGAWLAKAIGVTALILGGLQLVNVSTGGRDALAPLAQLGGGGGAQAKIDFKHVKSEAELDAVLAQTGGKPVILDFYADWCVSCLEMEKTTFVDPQVQAALGAFVLLKADVTANNANDKALLKRFKLFGPPGFIFFNAKGQKLDDKNLIGYENADQFLKRLNTIGPN